MYKEIGERIKHLRISKKLTQDEVAHALNVKRKLLHVGKPVQEI